MTMVDVLQLGHFVLTRKCQIIQFLHAADQSNLLSAAVEKSVWLSRSVSKCLAFNRRKYGGWGVQDYKKKRGETDCKQREGEIFVWPAVAVTNRRAKTQQRESKKGE